MTARPQRRTLSAGPTTTDDERRTTNDGVGLLLLRLFVGSFTLLAGVQIIVSDADFSEIVGRIGVPFASAAAFVVVLGHVVLGVLLILGLFTRAVGVLLAVKFYLIFLTYYVLQSDTTLWLNAAGTLRGVESLAYGSAGVFFACVGTGRLSLDALLRRPPSSATGSVLRLARCLFADTSRRPADRRIDIPAVGRIAFRVFIGGLLTLHSVYQLSGVSVIPGTGTEAMMRLSGRLDTLGLPMPTLIAWIATLAMLGAGVLLILGLFVRAGGVILAAAAAILFLAVPRLGGASVEGYGFHGEQLFFLTVVGVYFAYTDPRPLSVSGESSDASRHASVRPPDVASRGPSA